jgi:hypothetical protein
VTRGLSTAQAAAVAAPMLYAAVLVELDFAPDPIRLWAGIGDFVWGNRTFTGAGHLLGVGSPEERAEVSAPGMSLSLSGLPPEIIGHALAVTWQGRAARVWIGLLTEAGALVGEPVQVLAGRMDTLSWEEGETATVSLAVESRLADLERPRARRYTDRDQQAEFPGDTAFSFVTSLQERELKWGSGG